MSRSVSPDMVAFRGAEELVAIPFLRSVAGLNPLVWIAAVAAFAVAAKLAVGTVLAVPLALLLFVFPVIALVSPWLGLLAMFPLLFSMEATPAGVGLREMAFALLTATVCVGAIATAARTGELERHIKSLWLPVFAVFLLFAVNLVTALSNDIPLLDWLRGAVPFAFVGIFVPVAILISRDAERLSQILWAFFTVALLYVGLVFATFWIERLDEAVYYIKEGSRTVQVDVTTFAGDRSDLVGPFYYRVTAFVQQSTDVLLPVSAVAGYLLFVLAPTRPLRWIAGAFAWLAIITILMTYTRSMVLVVVGAVGLFGLVILFFDRSRFLSAFFKAVLLMLLAIISVFAIGMDVMWTNRVLELYFGLGLHHLFDAEQYPRTAQVLGFFAGLYRELISLLHAIAIYLEDYLRMLGLEVSDIFDGQGEQASRRLDLGDDENVTTRREEYDIALKHFYAQPISGAGFGIKHDITFVTSEGEGLRQSVSYVHNWFYYFLMVAGLPGLVAFASAMFAPVGSAGWTIWRLRRRADSRLRTLGMTTAHLLWAGLLVMALYGLTFAVFRLISFNLLLGAAIGVAFVLVWSLREIEKRDDERGPSERSVS